MITKYNKSIFALVASLLLIMAGCDNTTSSPPSQAPETKDLNNVTLWKTFDKAVFGNNLPDEILPISDSVAFAAGADGLYYYGDDQWKKVPLEGKNPAKGNLNVTLKDGKVSHLTKLADGRVVFVYNELDIAIAKPDGSGLDELWLNSEYGVNGMAQNKKITSIAVIKGADDKEAIIYADGTDYVRAQFDAASPAGTWDKSISSMNAKNNGYEGFYGDGLKVMPSPSADALYICRAEGCVKLVKDMIKVDGVTTNENDYVISGLNNAPNTWEDDLLPAHWLFTGKADNIVYSSGKGVGFKSTLKGNAGNLITTDQDLSAINVKQLVRVGDFIHVVSDDVIYRVNDEGKADDKIYLDTATGFMWASADDLAQKTESELASFSEKLTGLKRYAVEGNVSWYVLGDKVLMSKTGDIKVKNN